MHILLELITKPDKYLEFMILFYFSNEWEFWFHIIHEKQSLGSTASKTNVEI